MSALAVVLAVLAVVLATTALGVAVRSGPARRRRSDEPVDALPEDVHGLRQEVAALRAEAGDALRHLSVVRYDAFGDMGGHLSWSLALLDDAGHGVLLTSIHGRSEARTYAKSISGWSSEQQLSPEEAEAVEHARP
jgi:hypothetical protein